MEQSSTWPVAAYEIERAAAQPGDTVRMFCDSLSRGDVHRAYMTLDPAYRRMLSESKFSTELMLGNGGRSCTVIDMDRLGDHVALLHLGTGDAPTTFVEVVLGKEARSAVPWQVSRLHVFEDMPTIQTPLAPAST